ncbi:MAG: hypothetical protein ACRDHW_10340, partial [Ktedonobacteraceae bacterium]
AREIQAERPQPERVELEQGAVLEVPGEEISAAGLDVVEVAYTEMASEETPEQSARVLYEEIQGL